MQFGRRLPGRSAVLGKNRVAQILARVQQSPKIDNRFISIDSLSRFKQIDLLAPVLRLVCEALKGIGDNTASAFGFFKCAHVFAPSSRWRFVYPFILP
jgi:hypothetical protein